MHDLQGKAVFIGYAGAYQPKQRDGFYTVFSQDNGLDLSGVEIAATAFANLLQDETLTLLSPVGLLLLCLTYGVAMILVLSWHYRQMGLSREQLRELFGYYLPGDVIDRLAQDKEHTMERSDKAFGICLASDARQYTRLAEHMEPVALQAFLNRYYEILFAPVRRCDGVVSEVVGDAML